MAELLVRQARRTPMQKWFLDPIVALPVAGLWFFFKILPIRWASAIGGGLGWCFGFVARNRTRIMMRNLEIAFPEKTIKERRKIARKSWAHWGRFFAEMPHTNAFSENCTIVNGEFMEQMRMDGVGGFIVSAHLGNWEVVTALMAHFGIKKYGIVYRAANNPWLEKLMFKRSGILIPKGAAGARKMIELLVHKEHMALLADQKLNEGIPAPFFGKPAMSPGAMCSLAIRMNVPIYMGKSIRKKDGRFEVTFYPPVPVPFAQDKDLAVLEMMTKINQIMEGWIRENPEQWLWMHRRFDKSEYL